jgi:hypothetical protein
VQTAKNGTYSSFTNFYIGLNAGNGGAGQNWSGNIYEILMYNSVLSTTDRQKMNGYLSWKWNLQGNLPT